MSTDGQNLVAYDYLRHAGIRVGIGAILDSRKELQILPELSFTTRNIKLNNTYQARLWYGNLSGTARKDIVDDLVFVEGRLGVSFAITGQYISDEAIEEIDIKNPWGFGDRVFQINENGIDVTAGLGFGVRLPGLEQLAISVGVDFGLLTQARQLGWDDYFWYGNSNFSSGTEDRFRTIGISATYLLTK